MIPDDFILGLLGGLCIGLAAVLMMILIGRIAGISGIAYTAVRHPIGNFWAPLFVVGLVLGAGLFHWVSGQPTPVFNVPAPLIIAGGMIVGIGTKLGSGCTSGHGICGIGRLSTRSIIATCTFMIAGFATVYLRLHGGF